MKLIIGLGNPGTEYVNTRHNAGILLIDKLAESLSSDYGWRKHYDALIFKTPEITLVKTNGAFMNESGRLLQALPDGVIYLAHDDLDIKLGEFKVQRSKGPKVHRGVEAIENTLGTKDFWRIRIGIENRTQPIAGEDYVLQKFTPEEKPLLDTVLDQIADAVIETTN